MSPVRTLTRPTARRPTAPAPRSRSRKPDVSRFHVVIFTIMVGGALLGLLLIAEGLVMLDTQSLRAASGAGGPSATADQPAAGAVESAADQPAPGAAESAADLSISAEHLGELRVRVEVRVTMNEQRRPLQRATVQATLDMVQMPGAHTLGPLDLQEEGGEPGLYTAITTVPMLGDYDIQVHMYEPVHAQASHRITVDVQQPAR